MDNPKQAHVERLTIQADDIQDVREYVELAPSLLDYWAWMEPNGSETARMADEARQPH